MQRCSKFSANSSWGIALVVQNCRIVLSFSFFIDSTKKKGHQIVILQKKTQFVTNCLKRRFEMDPLFFLLCLDKTLIHSMQTVTEGL